MYCDGDWPEPGDLRITGAAQTGETELSLSLTGFLRHCVCMCMSLCVCALFYFNFELFILEKYRAGWMNYKIEHSVYCWCSVVYAKLSAHLYGHTHTHLCIHTNVHRHTCTHSCMFKHTCTFTHTFIYIQLCVEGYVSDQDTYGYLIVYSVLTCQVCLSSITCGLNLYCEEQ